MKQPPEFLWHINGVMAATSCWKNFTDFWVVGLLILIMLIAAFMIEVGKAIRKRKS